MHQAHTVGVDLNLLPTLMALLEERHVSRAATRVGMSQPAMSRALQRLRRLFDDPLLVPGPDGYTLTPRAERLRPPLASLIPELDALFGPEDFDPATAHETFRVALSDYSMALLGSDVARTVHRQSPASTLSYRLLDDDAFDALGTGAIDLLVVGRQASQRFSQKLLFTDHLVIAVDSAHRLAHRRQLTTEEYLSCPHVGIDIGHGGLYVIDQSVGSPRDVVISTPFHAFAPEMLLGTDLVLTFPARLTPKFAHVRDIRILAAPPQMPELTFYAVWHPRLDNDPGHQWLRGVISTAVGGSSPDRVEQLD